MVQRPSAGWGLQYVQFARCSARRSTLALSIGSRFNRGASRAAMFMSASTAPFLTLLLTLGGAVVMAGGCDVRPSSSADVTSTNPAPSLVVSVVRDRDHGEDRWIVALPHAYANRSSDDAAPRVAANHIAASTRLVRTDTLDLGAIRADRQAVAHLVLRNTTDEIRRIAAIETTCSCVSIEPMSREIEPHGDLPVSFRLRPGGEETVSAIVQVILDDATGIEIPIHASVADLRPMVTVARSVRVDEGAAFRIPLLIVADSMPAPAIVTLRRGDHVTGSVSSGPWRRVTSMAADDAGGASQTVWSADIEGTIAALDAFGVITVEVDGHRSADVFLSRRTVRADGGERAVRPSRHAWCVES